MFNDDLVHPARGSENKVSGAVDLDFYLTDDASRGGRNDVRNPTIAQACLSPSAGILPESFADLAC
jgi:hypothetical protein